MQGGNNKVIQSAALVLAGLLLGVLLKTGMAWQSRQQINHVATTFVSDITKGNNDGAYNLLSDKARALQTKDQVASTFYGMKTDKPSYSGQTLFTSRGRSLYVVKVSNLPATVDGNTSNTVTLTLVPSGTTWRVDSVSIQ